MGKPYVVAIAGGTCSGKSTLTDRLEALFSPRCKTVAFHMDSYFKKEPPNTIAPITRKEYVEHNHPDTLELPRMYEDFARVTAEGSDAQLVLAEGLFALYLDDIRERADLKIFVDLASDERLVRRIVRFMAWGQTFEEVTERYLDTVRFRHNELIEPTRWHADLVVNGTLDSSQAVDVAACFIEKKAGLL